MTLIRFGPGGLCLAAFSLCFLPVTSWAQTYKSPAEHCSGLIAQAEDRARDTPALMTVKDFVEALKAAHFFQEAKNSAYCINAAGKALEIPVPR